MASPEPATEAQSSRPHPPPLRIHHLMACGAVAALLFMIWRSQLRPENWKLVEAFDASTIVLFTAAQIIQATGVTLAGFSLYWHVKGYAAFVQPGQWLPVAISFAALRHLTMRPIHFLLVQSPWGENVLLWNGIDFLFAAAHFLAIVACYLLPIVLFAWLAWRVADTLPWRLIFALKASGGASNFFPAVRSDLFSYFQDYGWSFEATSLLLATIASVGMLACAVWAPANDRLRGIRRSWTHWVGLGLFLALYAVNALSYGSYFLKLL